jgi:hypothetical protein
MDLEIEQLSTNEKNEYANDVSLFSKVAKCGMNIERMSVKRYGKKI